MDGERRRTLVNVRAVSLFTGFLSLLLLAISRCSRLALACCLLSGFRALRLCRGFGSGGGGRGLGGSGSGLRMLVSKSIRYIARRCAHTLGAIEARAKSRVDGGGGGSRSVKRFQTNQREINNKTNRRSLDARFIHVPLIVMCYDSTRFDGVTVTDPINLHGHALLVSLILPQSKWPMMIIQVHLTSTTMSFRHVVGADFARSAPLPCYNKGTGWR